MSYNGNGSRNGRSDRDRDRENDHDRNRSRGREEQHQERGHSRDQSRGRDPSRGRDYNNVRDHSNGRDHNNGRDHSNGRDHNNGRDHSRGRDDYNQDRGQSRDNRDRSQSQHGDRNNGNGSGRSGRDEPTWGQGGRPLAGRARAAPPPTRGHPPMPGNETENNGNEAHESENGDAQKRHRQGSGDDGNSDGGSRNYGDRGSGSADRQRDGSLDAGREGNERGEVGHRGRGNGRGDRGGRGGGGECGRGGGRGGGRGMRRGGRYDEDYDLVVSRNVDADGNRMQKQAGTIANHQVVRLQGNFFKVDRRPDWCILHYHVDFKPDETDTRTRKALLRAHAPMLGAYIFDGASIYVSHRLEQPMVLSSTRQNDQEIIELTVKLVAELAPTDIMYLQLYNILVRKCLEGMELEEMGRHFYDSRQRIGIEAYHLELWPGYKTSMRNHENDVLLGVEITHKVLRLDNCLQVLTRLRSSCGAEKIKAELTNSIVMTVYNHKTYKIDDIDYNTTPSSTFEMKGEQISFIDYFKKKYNVQIRDGRQPMLVSLPKKRDFHRGQTGPILLVPELCQMTGLTDEMRSNMNLMRALSSHLQTDPVKRVAKLRDFMRKLGSKPEIQEELDRWGLRFQDRLIEFPGRVIPKENIMFGNSAVEVPNDKYDWSQAFRGKAMLSTVALRYWVVIVPSRDGQAVDKLVNGMSRVGRPLQFNITPPMDVIRLSEARPNDYAKAVDTIMNQHRDKVQLIFAILPKNTLDNYQAVKKRACLEFGVPSQCFVAKNAFNDKGLMSICTKVVVQLNAKLGGEPWTVSIPMKNFMVVGFDVYHCGKRRGSSIGAMVATTSSSLGKYFSCVSTQSSREELSEKMGTNFTKCLHAYQKINKDLPDRIIMYRDGVGDGQLKYVYETELKTIQEALESVYKSSGKASPKFSFIVVTKRINTRIFGNNRGEPNNPYPGTVVDDVITLPERYDFYLVAQFAKQGTVSPVSYNVLYDCGGLPPARMQHLTFKLCHLYFNWNGTVTVPAPCQYAHKLAYLTGLALGGPSHEKLSNLLYFL